MNAIPSSGAELAQAVDRRLTRAAIAANGAGAIVVGGFLVLLPLVSDPGEARDLLLRSVAFGVPYVLLTLWAGVAWGRGKFRRVHGWLEAGRAPTGDERQAVLGYPRVFSAIGAVLWGTGAVLFSVVNAVTDPDVGLVAGVVTLLGGTTTCALGYLLAERIERPVVALALAEEVPARPVGPGVRTRLTVAWVLASGVPVLGVTALGAAGLLGSDLDERALDASIVFLALVALGVGLYATLLAAQSVADPLAALRDAQARVQGGDLNARVPVADGSEVGLLQAGFNDMAAGLEERERLRDLFGRHVGRDVARAALADGELRLGGEVREVAVIFADVIGSTALAASRPPAEVVALLNAFFARVVEVTERNGGWVNKFEGDGALCVFGAPTPLDSPAGRGLCAARGLREALERELPQLDAAIGVSAGPAVAGNVGAEERYEYTVIGDPVNEAARLCELAKRRPERLLASAGALERAGEEERGHWELGDQVSLRGRPAPTRLAAPAAR